MKKTLLIAVLGLSAALSGCSGKPHVRVARAVVGLPVKIAGKALHAGGEIATAAAKEAAKEAARAAVKTAVDTPKVVKTALDLIP